MNDAAQSKLEFPAMREVLAAFCGTSAGKRLARTMIPSPHPHVVKGWLQQVQEMTAATADRPYPPMGGVHDIRNYIRAAAFPTPLDPPVFVQIADTLNATRYLCDWFRLLADSAPSLASLGRRIHDLSPIGAVIVEAIDERGQVRDHASPRLASIRRTIEEARTSIKIVFDRLLRQTGLTKMLQYTGSTFHDDRCVLPLKSEYRGRIPGIVHRSSDSGATLFVEPSESVELNNTIVRLRDEEAKEITQILSALTRRVHLNAEVILETVSAVAVVDLVAAKCRYAKKRKCICPVIDDGGLLDLHDARHPYLLEWFAREAEEGCPLRDVVPIDVRLGDDFDVLIVTGPNTGGKTVALKTVGLLALLNQCGVPIPVGEGSRLPVYKDVFIDVGDEQSIQQSLSTFSSHLTTLLEILRGSGPRSLVLIDELGAGTDPDEGAAIGRAVIAELLQLKAKAVVSTHLSNLKAVAYTTPRVDNASVEFDVASLKPTYRLRLGEPGNSNALIIAKRLGMPARLVQQARGFLDDRTRALNQAIAGTLESRREAEAARKSAMQAALDAQREKEKYKKDRRDLEQSQETFDRWTKWVHDLKPGDPVYLRSLHRGAKVVRMQLHKQIALVSAAGLDIEVALRELQPLPDT